MSDEARVIPLASNPLSIAHVYVPIIKAMNQCRGIITDEISFGPELVKKANHYIFHRRHYSLLETITFGFRVLNVSRSMVDQLRTHRLFSFYVRSMKVDKTAVKPKVVFPEKYNDEIKALVFNNFANQIALCETLMEMGVSRDHARLVMPLGTESSCIISGNARTWYEFLPKRLCKDASDEIRYFAGCVRAYIGMFIEPFKYVSCLRCGDCGSTENSCSECKS